MFFLMKIFYVINNKYYFEIKCTTGMENCKQQVKVTLINFNIKVLVTS